MGKLKNQIKMDGTQWDHLVQYGNITVGGTTYSADADTIYEINDYPNVCEIIVNRNAGTSGNSGGNDYYGDSTKQEAYTLVDWSKLKKYKFIYVLGSQDAGKVAFVFPINLIPWVAIPYSSTSSLPNVCTNFSIRFVGRLQTSTASTNANVVIAFANVYDTTTYEPSQIAIYNKNSSTGSRYIRIYLIGRNNDAS